MIQKFAIKILVKELSLINNSFGNLKLMCAF